MSKMTRVLAVLVLTALPAAAVAQGPGMGQRGPMGPRNPVTRVLAQKDSLKLTAEQVKQLQPLEAKLQKQNEPLYKQVQAKRAEFQPQSGPPTDEQRAQRRQAMEELRPVMEQIRKNDQETMDAVFKLLTPDQQQSVRAMMRRGPRGGMGPAGPGRRGADRGAWRTHSGTGGFLPGA